MAVSAKAVVERLTEEVWNRGDLEVIDELVAETFVDHWALPGERDGREGLRELVRHVREAFPDFHITRFEVIGEDNWIGERWSAAGTHMGPFLGVPPTGVQVSLRGVAFCRIERGQVVENYGLIDELSLLRQIGALPAGPQATAPTLPTSAGPVPGAAPASHTT
jgi:steroid delta-isomerase-like uncharacterized protein